MKQGRFIIVGAGDVHPEDLTFEREADDVICAADAGHLALLKAGILPDLIIGDFDSSEFPEVNTEIIQLPVEKDDTDTVYCVKEGLKRGYRQFLIIGALGGRRISHTVANIQMLSMIREAGAYAEIIAGKTTMFILRGGESHQFTSDCTGTVSFFALSDQAVVSMNNFYYSLEEGELSRFYPLGVSNHFIGKEAEIRVRSGEVLSIVESEMD